MDVRPLTPEEMDDLKEFLELTNDARLHDRARMVWPFHRRNHTIQEIAAILNTHEDMVAKWIEQFEKDGFEGLHDKPRSGRPRRAG